MGQKAQITPSRLQKFRLNFPDRFWAVIIFLLAFLQFSNTLTHDYAWDDAIVITQNSRTQKGFAGIPDQWKEHTRETLEDFSGYRPLTLTSFTIDVGIFGPKPGPAHAMNVIYFGLLCIVIFFTLRKLFPDHHRYFALLVTLLFLAHPLHTEVVANIKSRDEIFVMLFGMLSLNSWLNFLKGSDWKWGLLTLGFLILASLSRQNGIVFIFTYPLAAFILSNATTKQKIFSFLIIPISIGLMVGVFWLLTGRFPTEGSAVKPEGYLEGIILGNSFFEADSLWERIGSATRLIFLYLRDFIFPWKLSYYSGYNSIPFLDWNHRILALPFLGSVFGFLYAIIQLFRSRQKELAFGILWFLLFIAVYLQIFITLADTKADRFAFVPSLGLCLLTIALVSNLFKIDWTSLIPQSNSKTSKPYPPKYKTGVIVLSVLILGMSIRTFARNTVWKDNMTLFSTDIGHLEDCSRCNYFLAREIASNIDHSKTPQKDQVALLAYFRKAISITDSAYYAYVDFANELLRFRGNEEAEKYMERAIKIYPNQEDPWYYLGKAEFFQDKFGEAAGHFEKAKTLNPDQPENWELWGRSLERSGNYAQAQQALSQAKQLFPNQEMIVDALVDAYFFGDNKPAAFAEINALVKSHPENSFWWKKRIGLYETAGMSDSAAFYFQAAQANGKLQ